MCCVVQLYAIFPATALLLALMALVVAELWSAQDSGESVSTASSTAAATRREVELTRALSFDRWWGSHDGEPCGSRSLLLDLELGHRRWAHCDAIATSGQQLLVGLLCTE